MPFTKRLLVTAASYILPERTSLRLARASLATQSVDWAGSASGLRGSGKVKFLKRQIGPLQKTCIFDVGANVRQYIASELQANPGAQVHRNSELNLRLTGLRSASQK